MIELEEETRLAIRGALMDGDIVMLRAAIADRETNGGLGGYQVLCSPSVVDAYELQGLALRDAGKGLSVRGVRMCARHGETKEHAHTEVTEWGEFDLEQYEAKLATIAATLDAQCSAELLRGMADVSRRPVLAPRAPDPIVPKFTMHSLDLLLDGHASSWGGRMPHGEFAAFGIFPVEKKVALPGGPPDFMLRLIYEIDPDSPHEQYDFIVVPAGMKAKRDPEGKRLERVCAFLSPFNGNPVGIYRVIAIS